MPGQVQKARIALIDAHLDPKTLKLGRELAEPAGRIDDRVRSELLAAGGSVHGNTGHPHGSTLLTIDQQPSGFGVIVSRYVGQRLHMLPHNHLEGGPP